MNEEKNEIIGENKINIAKELKEMNELIEEYITTFDEKDQLAYKIAQEHLQSSFSLEKSIGFNRWLKSKKK